MRGLPIIALPVNDELLTSWLDRTALLHGLERQQLLTWAGCHEVAPRSIDEDASPSDVTAIARLMRASEGQIVARTHKWLGELRGQTVISMRLRIDCARCSNRLKVLHGALVRLKSWSEAWRIRCASCGDILTQNGDEAFSRELRWDWYDPIIAAADDGSESVAEAIRLILSGVSPHGHRLGQSCLHGSQALLPLSTLAAFGFGKSGMLCRPLSGLCFAYRLFVLSTAAARRPIDGQHARHLLDIWLQNRSLHRRTERRRRRRKVANPSLKINVNLRLGQRQSQITDSKNRFNLDQSHN
jgi:hypothetical protein